jgi:hypothetical protein
MEGRKKRKKGREKEGEENQRRHNGNMPPTTDK